METLYDALNDHLMGANETPTDAYKFAADVTAMAEWVGGGITHQNECSGHAHPDLRCQS